MMKKLTLIVVPIVLLVTLAFQQNSEQKSLQITIQEWEVPWEESRPRDPYVAPDGDVWFVGQRTHYVAEFDPETESFRKIDLEDGAGPHTVVVDSEGNPWYAGNRANHIGKIDPESGKITKIMMPDDMSARDPHTIAFNEAGNFWFTSQGANSIGFMNTETMDYEIIPVPTQRAPPYGIIAHNDGVTPWIVLFGTNKLATVDPQTMELKEIELPDADSRPRRLAQTSDGRIWYGDYSRGYLGVYDPAEGTFEEWAMPSGESSRPYGMTVDDKDRLWLVETGVQPNMFVGFDPATNRFVGNEAIPSGGGSVRHMDYDQKTQSVWFGTDTNYLGVARLD